MSALIQFGLLNQEGSKKTRTVQLTSLAVLIIKSMAVDGGKGDTELLRNAVFNSSIIKHIWEEYSTDGGLPDRWNLEGVFQI